MNTYSTSDFVQISPLEMIRRNPSMFLLSGKPTGAELSGLIVAGALRAGAKTVCSVHREGWWIIKGDADWVESLDQFHEIMTFAEGDCNSIRPEVLLTAFAQDLATGLSGSQATIKGEFPAWSPHQDGQHFRWIAFRLPT